MENEPRVNGLTHEGVSDMQEVAPPPYVSWRVSCLFRGVSVSGLAEARRPRREHLRQ